jgi:hypothetical protein
VSHNQVMTDVYEYDGNQYQRASREDFQTLPERVMEAVESIPGFEGNDELINYMTQSVDLYTRGEYSEAKKYLIASVDRIPEFKPYLLHYIRLCERVLAMPLTRDDKRYAADATRYLSRASWLRKFFRAPLLKMRCKWCGRYTPYIDPDTPTFGFDTLANSCRFCGRMYAMPSWVWDSPDGRAYSYYRMSFKEEVFYSEFETDYDPIPRCQRRLALADERRMI